TPMRTVSAAAGRSAAAGSTGPEFAGHGSVEPMAVSRPASARSAGFDDFAMNRSCLREAGLPGHDSSVDFRAGSAPFEIFRRGMGPMFAKRGAADRKEWGCGDRR